MTRFSAEWSRRTFLRGALASGAIVLPGAGLVGCASGGGGGQKAEEGDKTNKNPLGVPVDAPLEIVIFNGGFGDKYATDVHEPMYTERYPKAKITHVAEVDIAGTLQSRFVSGKPPDFVNNSGTGQIPLGQMVDQKQLYDLTELYDAPSWDDPNKKVRDTLVPGNIELGSFNGTPYVLHMATSIFGIWYNKALFDKNSWEAPTTWDDMLKLCDEIKKAGIAPWTYQGVHARYMSWPLLVMAAKHGGVDVLKAIDNLEEGAWAHESIQESAAALQKLRTKEFFLEGSEGMTHIQSQAAWSLGQAAFVPCGSWLESEQADATPKEGFEFAFMPEPALSKNDKMPKETLRATPGEPYIVPAKAKNPKGAMEYMRIMLSKKGAQGYTEVANTLTANKDAAEGMTLPPGLTSARKALTAAGENVVNWFFPTWYRKLENPAVNSHMQELLAGRIDPKEFSKRCDESFKAIKDDDAITKYTRK